MTDSRMIGHAMRRRFGGETNHLAAALMSNTNPPASEEFGNWEHPGVGRLLSQAADADEPGRGSTGPTFNGKRLYLRRLGGEA